VSRVRDDGLAFGVGRPGQSGREEEDLDAAVCGTGGQRVHRPPVTGRDERSVGVVPLGDVGPSRSRSTRRTRSELSEEQPERTFRTDTFGYFRTARATGSHLEAGAAIVDTTSR
jgi:NAD(P)-dependent dehydrogenase (short-subunit alcohol dehydrogenase family)